MPIEWQKIESTEQQVDTNAQSEPKPYNPNSALKAEIAEMEAKDREASNDNSYDLDNAFEWNENSKEKEISNLAKTKVANLVLDLINNWDDRMKYIIDPGWKEMYEWKMLTFVESLKQNWADAVEFDYRPNSGFPLRVSNWMGSTPIPLTQKELWLTDNEMVAMFIILKQNRIESTENQIKIVTNMSDEDFNKSYAPQKYNTTRESIIDRENWEVIWYNNNIKELRSKWLNSEVYQKWQQEMEK